MVVNEPNIMLVPISQNIIFVPANGFDGWWLMIVCKYFNFNSCSLDSNLWGDKFLVTVNWLHDVAYGPLDLKPLDARRPQKGMAHEAKPTTASMALASMDLKLEVLMSDLPILGQANSTQKITKLILSVLFEHPFPSIPKREIYFWIGSCMSQISMNWMAPHDYCDHLKYHRISLQAFVTL